MSSIIEISDDFWNLRGSFKVGPLDIGTQASLVRLASGRFVMLDAYTLEGEVAERVLERTEGGKAVEAVFHLHPFHTIHVKRHAAMFPEAKQYGTRRHKDKAPELNWEKEETDQPAFSERYADDFAFSVPRGVDFISDDPKLHFSSVLAFHRASRTLHVDDTLVWNPLPLIGGLRFHPTLAKVLEKHAQAVPDFRAWAQELITLCGSVDHICVAHARPFPSSKLQDKSAADRVTEALAKVESTLKKHARQHG